MENTGMNTNNSNQSAKEGIHGEKRRIPSGSMPGANDWAAVFTCPNCRTSFAKTSLYCPFCKTKLFEK